MTVQINEKLIYDSKEFRINIWPLPLFFNHPRILALSENEWATLQQQDSFPTSIDSTACRRGYIGTWTIRDGRFYLLDLNGRLRLEGKAPLFADWFSGVLRIPLKKSLDRSPLDLNEKERHIQIEKGIVMDIQVCNRNDQDRAFELF